MLRRLTVERNAGNGSLRQPISGAFRTSNGERSGVAEVFLATSKWVSKKITRKDPSPRYPRQFLASAHQAALACAFVFSSAFPTEALYLQPFAQ